jgi:hypothetical protein
MRFLVTEAGIEPAARALKVRCSTTELPGRAESAWCVGQSPVRRFSRRAGHCTTLNRVEISVFSHDITIDPPALGSRTIAKVRTSTGVERSRF